MDGHPLKNLHLGQKGRSHSSRWSTTSRRTRGSCRRDISSVGPPLPLSELHQTSTAGKTHKGQVYIWYVNCGAFMTNCIFCQRILSSTWQQKWYFTNPRVASTSRSLIHWQKWWAPFDPYLYEASLFCELIGKTGCRLLLFRNQQFMIVRYSNKSCLTKIWLWMYQYLVSLFSFLCETHVLGFAF